MSLWNDVRLALRALARDRVYACVAILTLGFGLAANTIIFSIVDGVLLRPLRYREPGRLVVVNEVVAEFAAMYPRLPVAARHYLEWRDRASSFDGLAVVQSDRCALTGAGEPEEIETARVSVNLLPLLGAVPQVGRNFLPDEDHPGHDNVVIISDGLWSRRFGRDPRVVGRAIVLDGVPSTIVGVVPASFHLPRSEDEQIVRFPSRADLYQPIAFKLDRLEWAGPYNYSVIGRLKAGVTLRKAAAELDVLESAIAARIPDKMHLHTAMRELQAEVTSASRTPLLVLLGAVGAVLLIVCVNLANLALARGATRSRDLAVRRALGATRGQLVRHVLAETICLATAGGVVGLLLARLGLSAVLARAPFDIPRLDEVGLDARVLAFSFGLAVLTGLLFGLLPAWRAAAVDPQQTLGGVSRTTEGRVGRVTRNLLVAFESALGATLLIVAGLLVASFFHLLAVDKGFDADRTLTARITAPRSRYAAAKADAPARHAYYRTVLDKLQVVPGVRSAAIISQLPLEGETWVDVVRKEGDTRPMTELPPTNYRFCSAEYFRTMGVRLARGTTFTEADRERRLAVVSEATARAVWGDEDPIGKKFTRGGDADSAKEPLIEVAGLVRDVSVGLGSKPVPTVYLPYWSTEDEGPAMKVVLRTAADPRAVARSVRETVWSVDRDTVVGEMRTMDELVSTSVAGRRFEMLLVGGFALSALLLACLGIYGVVSWSVTRRRHEIGIRMALGAGGAAVRRMLVWQGMRPVVAGLGLGVAGALALGRVVATLLFGVSPRDPLTIAAVLLALCLVAIFACYVPARRATVAEPLRALHYE